MVKTGAEYAAAHTLEPDQPLEHGKPITWRCKCGWSIEGPKKDWYRLKLAAIRHRNFAIGEDLRAAPNAAGQDKSAQ